MKDLLFSQIDPFYNPDSREVSSKFDVLDLKEGQVYAAGKGMKIQVVYLLKGSVWLDDRKREAIPLREGEFFFTRNTVYVCRAGKRSRLVVFEIEKESFHSNPSIQREHRAVSASLKHLKSPHPAPAVLSLFFENMADYSDRGIDAPLFQHIKRRELYLLLTSLYPGNGIGELLMYNQFSLS